MTRYARKPRGREDHIVRGTTGTTWCGLELAGFVVWDAKYGPRTDIRPTCGTCRVAPKE